MTTPQLILQELTQVKDASIPELAQAINKPIGKTYLAINWLHTNGRIHMPLPERYALPHRSAS